MKKQKTSKVAVVPARGGSTRLKGKNIYPLGGKPLICHSLDTLVQLKTFDKIYVSTDDEDIAHVASSYPEVELYHRPSHLADERTPVLQALLAMMEDLPRHDIFSYYLPTCPFRSGEDVLRGLSLLTPDTDSVVSVSAYQEPPQIAMIRHGDEMLPVFDNLQGGMTNSKFLNQYHHPNGAFFMAWWDRLLENRNFFCGRVKGHVMPKERSVDIDDIYDLRYAEAVYAIHNSEDSSKSLAEEAS